MDDKEALHSPQIPAAPFLSRLLWLAEHLQDNADELTVLFGSDGILADLNAEEFHELRRAVTEASTAAGKHFLLATAARGRRAKAVSATGSSLC